MRTLFTLGAIVAAMLVPWSSLAPNWLPDAAGSPVSPSPTKNPGRSVAWLNPALGIMPINQNDVSGNLTESAAADEVAGGSRVVCENGVCRVVDDLSPDSIVPPPMAGTSGNALEDRLHSLGATLVRVESDADGDDSRAACGVPVVSGSKVMRRFEACGPTDAEAMTRLAEQIEAWLVERQ
jgi:hypothetical protein